MNTANSFPGSLPTNLLDADLFAARDPSANLAALAVHGPGMGTTLESLAAQPLNSRRPAAPSLPSFELPPPPYTLGGTNKYPSQPPASHPPATQPPANVSVGNLLTPPATNQSGEATATSHTLAPSTGGSSDLPPTYWPSPYGTGPQTWANPAYSARNSYSPSGMVGRPASMTSPPTSDGLTHHHFEAPPLASYPQALPAPPSSLPPNGAHPATMGLYAPGAATSPAPLPSNDPYTPKGPMYGAPSHMSSPHQGYSPMYGGPPPIGAAGLGIHPSARMPAQSPTGQPHLGFPRQPWPSYSLPAMNGPVMTNVHSPNSPMSIMGGMQPQLLPGFNSGHLANAHHMYGGHPSSHGIPAPAADRPFKCDQCPQSFNRNHDLKRHKRIHLAVKPFPCAHCNKSFSRKDALKVCVILRYVFQYNANLFSSDISWSKAAAKTVTSIPALKARATAVQP